MLVLCGSLISLMVEQTLAHGSPLYGRRTAQLHMRQLPFSCYGEFFPEESSERKLVELFSVTGGVPKYIELFDAQKDIYASICLLYTSRAAPLPLTAMMFRKSPRRPKPASATCRKFRRCIPKMCIRDRYRWLRLTPTALAMSSTEISWE